MTPFSPTDPATWPATLTAEQVADIFQRKVGGLKKAVQRKEFDVRPFRTKPYRWRKSDIQRVVRAA
jgi:hypothetical protein